MIYDGDCGFCARWICRARRMTGDLADDLPYQDPRVAARYPEIPRTQFESSVHWIGPDGAVCRGAEAVFRLLSVRPFGNRLLAFYESSPRFARLSERLYGFVARHRQLFSTITP